jgi:hypothetical protein
MNAIGLKISNQNYRRKRAGQNWFSRKNSCLLQKIQLHRQNDHRIAKIHTNFAGLSLLSKISLNFFAFPESPPPLFFPYSS